MHTESKILSRRQIADFPGDCGSLPPPPLSFNYDYSPTDRGLSHFKITFS
jgi:hypothetical protein